MFLKKVCIFLAVSFLAVDILLLSMYIQATNNLKLLSDNMLENTVKYYNSAGIEIDKEDIMRRVPDNKIYTFSSDNSGVGMQTAQSLSQQLFSKNAVVNAVETPEGLSYSITSDGKTAASLRVYSNSFGFEYVFGDSSELATVISGEAFSNDRKDIPDEDRKAAERFMQAICSWSKPCYRITGSKYCGGKLCISIRQIIDDGCFVEDMFVNAIVEDGSVVYAKGNIILSPTAKSYSEPLYDGVNALSKVDSSAVSEFISEQIVYTHRYAGNSVYYLIPMWKIEYLDISGKTQIQYIDAIKN